MLYWHSSHLNKQKNKRECAPELRVANAKKKVEKSEYETTEGHKEIDDRGVKSSNNSTVSCNFVDGGEIQILFLQFSSAILQITRKWELSSLPRKIPFRWNGGSAYYHKKEHVFSSLVRVRRCRRTKRNPTNDTIITRTQLHDC